ncbi:MAG TPA: hypothetical protein EYO58_05905, partial [Flavobacteriales bacterium]|nr:hypothetical protein [Flavobacteriales bacterium]
MCSGTSQEIFSTCYESWNDLCHQVGSFSDEGNMHHHLNTIDEMISNNLVERMDDIQVSLNSYSHLNGGPEEKEELRMQIVEDIHHLRSEFSFDDIQGCIDFLDGITMVVESRMHEIHETSDKSLIFEPSGDDNGEEEEEDVQTQFNIALSEIG